jgi:O-antigen/teichoic acid export membrane protein
LVLPLALAAAVRGVTSLYNMYLGANARGRELRNVGSLLAGSNLALNFALIPTFGATGAAWASFGALIVNFAGHVFYYRRARLVLWSRLASPTGDDVPPLGS